MYIIILLYTYNYVHMRCIYMCACTDFYIYMYVILHCEVSWTMLCGGLLHDS